MSLKYNQKIKRAIASIIGISVITTGIFFIFDFNNHKKVVAKESINKEKLINKKELENEIQVKDLSELDKLLEEDREKAIEEYNALRSGVSVEKYREIMKNKSENEK